MPETRISTTVRCACPRKWALTAFLLAAVVPACLPMDSPLPLDGPWIVIHRNHLVTASIDTSRIAMGAQPLVRLRFDYATPDTVGDPPEVYHRAEFDLRINCRRSRMQIMTIETFDSAGASFGVERMDSFREWTPLAGHPFEPIAPPLCALLRARAAG